MTGSDGRDFLRGKVMESGRKRNGRILISFVWDVGIFENKCFSFLGSWCAAEVWGNFSLDAQKEGMDWT